MNKHIYTKLAFSNILKNGKIYLPYLLTVLGSLMIYFLIGSIGSNPNIYNIEEGTEAFKGAMTLCGIIQSGTFVMSLFLFIFLLYANSFVLKHQKKQFGLYRVLGMERKHIAKIIFVQKRTTFVTAEDKMRIFIVADVFTQPLPHLPVDSIVKSQRIIIDIDFPTDTAIVSARTLYTFKILIIIGKNREHKNTSLKHFNTSFKILKVYLKI